MNERDSSSDLFPLVYEELRRLAAAKMSAENANHTLSATALVHEAYLRLAAGTTARAFNDQTQFLFAAAQAMQRILVDHARRKRADKRGGSAKKVSLDLADPFVIDDPDQVLLLDEALGILTETDQTAASIARLRLFAGLSVDEAAASLGVTRATAFRDWAFARAFLADAIGDNAN